VLLLGGLAAAAAALLAGTSGFGYGLLATPMLLLAGFSLPFVVTLNLLVSLATRISVAYRLRAVVDRGRVALLVGGAIPGLALGALVVGSINASAVKRAAGVVVMLAAVGLALGERWESRRRQRRRLTALAGLLGGFLGTTTSLLGVPPALLLARRRVAAAPFFADLAVYFVVGSAIGLVLLAVEGGFDVHALPAFFLWVPGLLVANVVGTTLGLRLPDRAFRRATLALAFVAGALTAANA